MSSITRSTGWSKLIFFYLSGSVFVGRELELDVWIFQPFQLRVLEGLQILLDDGDGGGLCLCLGAKVPRDAQLRVLLHADAVSGPVVAQMGNVSVLLAGREEVRVELAADEQLCVVIASRVQSFKVLSHDGDGQQQKPHPEHF